MELWTGFILGLAGSAHCAGMCGPLALALPSAGKGGFQHVFGRFLYNLGRITTYAGLGAVFGLLGRSLALAGVQRWFSVGIGIILLVGVIFSRRLFLKLPATGLTVWLKPRLGRLLHRRTLGAMYAFGLLNGLLPCGLVYVACAGAASLGDWLAGVNYMLAFGLGTVPMMLALGLAGRVIPAGFRLRLQRVVPWSLALVGGLLILRGASLGIPYLSPDLSGDPAACCLPPAE